jgi:hypothetical protein
VRGAAPSSPHDSPGGVIIWNDLERRRQNVGYGPIHSNDRKGAIHPILDVLGKLEEALRCDRDDLEVLVVFLGLGIEEVDGSDGAVASYAVLSNPFLELNTSFGALLGLSRWRIDPSAKDQLVMQPLLSACQPEARFRAARRRRTIAATPSTERIEVSVGQRSAASRDPDAAMQAHPFDVEGFDVEVFAVEVFDDEGADDFGTHESVSKKCCGRALAGSPLGGAPPFVGTLFIWHTPSFPFGIEHASPAALCVHASTSGGTRSARASTTTPAETPSATATAAIRASIIAFILPPSSRLRFSGRR